MAASDIIFETEHWSVEALDNQAYLGRAIVIEKDPTPSIPEIAGPAWVQLHEVMSRYEQAVKQAFGATMFNWACNMNDAYKHAPAKPQVHWHVWPRYLSVPKAAGETFPDPNFAHFIDNDAERIVPPRTKAILIMEIQRADYAN